MALVQAYRRTKDYTHAFTDGTLVFQPNAQGDVVCDVQDPGRACCKCRPGFACMASKPTSQCRLC